MKSKSRKSDKKSAHKGVTSSHRLTSAVTKTSPSDASSPVIVDPSSSSSSAAAAAAAAAAPTQDSLSLASGNGKNSADGSKSTGRGVHQDHGQLQDASASTQREGSDVGKEAIGTSLVFVGNSEVGSDGGPEVAETPETRHDFLSFNVHSGKPPNKKMKMNKETQPTVVKRCNAGVLTDPDWLGPCDPGSSVILEGIVWNESRNGLLVVNVTWRGKTYVGTLMDSTNHHWASPSFKEDSLSAGGHLSIRDEETVAMAPAEGRRLRRCRTTQTNCSSMATAPSSSSSSSSKASNAKARCRVQASDVQTVMSEADHVSSHSCELVVCPERHCQKKFKHEAALRNHRFRAHKAAATVESITVQEPTATTSALITDDAGRKTLNGSCKVQNDGVFSPSAAKQKSVDDVEDDSQCITSIANGVLRRNEDCGKLCRDRDNEHLESECRLIKSTSGLDDEAGCFVLCPSESSASTISFNSEQSSSSANLPASNEMAITNESSTDKAADSAAIDLGDCFVRQIIDGATVKLMQRCDNNESNSADVDRQNANNLTKRKCKGKVDRTYKDSVVTNTSSSQPANMFATQACHGTSHDKHQSAVHTLQVLQDKTSAKKLKMANDVPVSVLSVSLNRIVTEKDSTATRSATSCKETRNNEQLHYAEKSENCTGPGTDVTVKCLGMDVKKLCISSSVGNSVESDSSSQKLNVTRETTCKCPFENKLDAESMDCSFGSPAKTDVVGDAVPRKIARLLSDTCQPTSSKCQSCKADGKMCHEYRLTPSLLMLRTSKNSHDKTSVPSAILDGGRKQPASAQGIEGVKPAVDNCSDDPRSLSHFPNSVKPKTDNGNSVNALRVQNSHHGAKASEVGATMNQVVQERGAGFPHSDQTILNRNLGGATHVADNFFVSNEISAPAFTKDVFSNLNMSANIPKDSVEQITSSRNTVPFAVPRDAKSLSVNAVAWNQPSHIFIKQNIQQISTASSSSSPQATYTTTFKPALPSPSASLDCSFASLCRTIQVSQTSMSLPKQVTKACTPSSSLSSCPLEANTASEVFARRDAATWATATAGKHEQHMISTSCPEQSLLERGSNPPVSSIGLHQGVGPYQQKKEKLISALHSSAIKPTASNSRCLFSSHSVQTACPK